MDDNIGIGDFWILKIDRDGNEQWQKTIGGDQDDQLYVVHRTFDGNFLVGGNSNSQSLPNPSEGGALNTRFEQKSIEGTDFWVLKLDPDGKIIWQETYNIDEVDVLTSLVENIDHTILLGGFAQSEASPPTPLQRRGVQKDSKGINDFVAIKINENGEEIWRRTVGSDGEDLLKKAIETRDGGYLLAGTSNHILHSLQSLRGTKQFQVTLALTQTKKTNNSKTQKNEVINAIGDVQKDINNGIKDKTDNVTKRINEALKNEDNPFKLSVNSPTGEITLPSLGDGNTSNNSKFPSFGGVPEGRGGSSSQENKSGSKGTGDQSKIFGSNDFWVVKLKDSNKPKIVKATIEALPNPATTFTNIIVGYDFTNGTASVYDLAGRQLQSFKISSRTVPIDLSELPEGIYKVNINTNIQQDGIKVIKNNVKK